MKPLALLIAGFFLSTVVFNLSSCRKETDCIASVKCVDSIGNALSDVNILLYAPVKGADGKTTYTGDVTASGNTDGGGQIKFTFKLPAIYDIKATLAVGSRTLNGSGVIKLEEGKTTEKTVTVK